MIDHPITQKVLATVVAAGMLAVGGASWKTVVDSGRHEAEINSLKGQQVMLGTSVVRQLEGIQTDVGAIKTDVAVLKERTERLNAAELRDATRP